MRDFIAGVLWVAGLADDPDPMDRLYGRKAPSLRLRWINFWRSGVRGFTVTCDRCQRSLHVHHYAPGPRMHMCMCTEIGNIMSIPWKATHKGGKAT